MKRKQLVTAALMVGFLLGISDGYIALWRDGGKTPVRVFPYKAETLPIADQQALEKGIPLDDDSALIRLLEDYLS